MSKKGPEKVKERGWQREATHRHSRKKVKRRAHKQERRLGKRIIKEVRQ